MSASAVQSEVLEPMQRLFLPPRNMDEGQQASALREYVSALDGFDTEDLRAGWKIVRDTHVTRSWPVPGALVNAARAARKDRQPVSVGASGHPFKRPMPSELWARWLEVRKQPVAKEAARRNLAWSFKCAVLDGTEIVQIDLRDLAMKKAQAERTAQLIDTDQPVPWKGRMVKFDDRNANTAMRMWRQIEAREIETQQEILAA